MGIEMKRQEIEWTTVLYGIPAKKGDYLVTTAMKNIGVCRFDGVTFNPQTGIVIAWAPMPLPYGSLGVDEDD